MKLIANDLLRITAATPSKLSAGDEFEINDDEGAILVARGLARAVDANAEAKAAAEAAAAEAAAAEAAAAEAADAEAAAAEAAAAALHVAEPAKPGKKG